MPNLTTIQPILDRFKKSAQDIYGDRLVKVLLYGSYARGEQHEDSDIDLMVVLKDEGFDKKRDDKLLNHVSFDFLYNDGELVMPLVLSEKRFETDNSPILYFARKDLIEL